MKKLTCVMAVLVMLLTLSVMPTMPVKQATAAGKDVTITPADFPDKALWEAICKSANYSKTTDADGNTEITYTINFSRKELTLKLPKDKTLKSLKGLEKFTNLRSLSFEGGAYKHSEENEKLLKKMAKLSSLSFEKVKMASFRLNGYPKMQSLYFNECKELTACSVTNCAKLSNFSSFNCKKLANVKLSKLPKLSNLSLYHASGVKTIDVSGFTNLKDINLTGAKVQTLDLSKNKKLEGVSISSTVKKLTLPSKLCDGFMLDYHYPSKQIKKGKTISLKSLIPSGYEFYSFLDSGGDKDTKCTDLKYDKNKKQATFLQNGYCYAYLGFKKGNTMMQISIFSDN